MGTHRSVSQHAGDVVGSPLSQEQWICSTLLMTPRKVATYEDICGLAQEAYVSYVSGFSCRVYINSNHFDSRI
jgi:hypothetical protein